MTLYYQEKNGDYLAIQTETNNYYRRQGKDHFEGRATAIANMAESVCTTGISREFLRTNCKRVSQEEIPEEWLKAIG